MAKKKRNKPTRDARVVQGRLQVGWDRRQQHTTDKDGSDHAVSCRAPLLKDALVLCGDVMVHIVDGLLWFPIV